MCRRQEEEGRLSMMSHGTLSTEESVRGVCTLQEIELGLK